MNNKTENHLDYEYVALLEALQKGIYWWIIPFFILGFNFLLSFFIKTKEFPLIENFFSMTGLSFVLSHIVIVVIGSIGDNISRQIYTEATKEHPQKINLVHLAYQRRTLYTVFSLVIVGILMLIFVCNTLPQGFFKDIFLAIYHSDFKLFFGIYLFFALNETLKTRKILELAQIIGE